MFKGQKNKQQKIFNFLRGMTKTTLKIVGLFALAFLLFGGAVSKVSASEVTGEIQSGMDSGDQGVVITTPTAAPAAGTYEDSTTVSLTATGSSGICYTTSGTTPVCAASGLACTTGTLYGGAISISTTTTVKAISCYPNNNHSTVASLVYTITHGGAVQPPSGGGGGGGSGTVLHPPVITTVSAQADTYSATINWATDVISDSLVNYGLTTTYGKTVSATAYTKSHSMALTGLSAFTTYHYQVKSTNGDGAGTYTDKTFTTLAVKQLVVGTGSVTSGGGSVLATTETGATGTITVPAGAVGANTVFTITPVGTTGSGVGNPPTGSFMVGNDVFNLTATSGGVAVTTFSSPVTLTFTYTDSQISGLNESTLTVYRWNGTQWVALTGTVNADNNTITATTTQFSKFAVMGQKSTTTTTTTGVMTREQILAKIAEIQVLIVQLTAQLQQLLGTPSTTAKFNTDLSYGMSGSEVKRMQEFMISKGYLKAGLNTGSYLSLTASAVKDYQIAKGITGPNGRFGPMTRAAANKDLGL